MSFSITFIFFILPLIICSYYLLWRPTSLWSGFWASYCIGTLFFLGIVQIERINQRLAFFIALPFALLLIVILLFGIFAMIIALFWNEKILLKYESPSLGNFLPIILAVVLIVFEVIMLFFSRSIENTIILELFNFFNLCFVYFGSLFLFYGITTILYNLLPVVGKVDYIIILGAGLKGEELTPLLASRVDRGVKLYRKQQIKGYQPVFILSGGKGSDEAISEAEAMKRYFKKNIN